MIMIRTHCPLRHESNGNCLPQGGFCTAVNDEICEALQRAYNHGFTDFARRAINAIEELNAVSFYELNEHSEEAYKDIKAAIRRIQPADVRLVARGHWVWNKDGIDWNIGAWCCSECGCKPETWWEGMKNVLPLRCAGSKFCGNCGADMRE